VKKTQNLQNVDGEEKMNKSMVVLLSFAILYSAYGYNGSTTAVVTLVGGIIKSHQIENTKKYKRKDCPVCKGKGWYMSGDDITKVPCGYCEPNNSGDTNTDTETEVTHPPIILSPNCKTKVIKR
jgi:hypothetical protein